MRGSSTELVRIIIGAFLLACWPEGRTDAGTLLQRPAVCRPPSAGCIGRCPRRCGDLSPRIRHASRPCVWSGTCDAAALRAPLPRVLSDQQLGTLLKAFDRSTAIGRRDYAITLCPAQLGLRAGEVAALTLDDIDWRSATLQLVRAKERRASILTTAGTSGPCDSQLPASRPTTDTEATTLRAQPCSLRRAAHLRRRVSDRPPSIRPGRSRSRLPRSP